MFKKKKKIIFRESVNVFFRHFVHQQFALQRFWDCVDNRVGAVTIRQLQLDSVFPFNGNKFESRIIPHPGVHFNRTHNLTNRNLTIRIPQFSPTEDILQPNLHPSNSLRPTPPPIETIPSRSINQSITIVSSSFETRQLPIYSRPIASSFIQPNVVIFTHTSFNQTTFVTSTPPVFVSTPTYSNQNYFANNCDPLSSSYSLNSHRPNVVQSNPLLLPGFNTIQNPSYFPNTSSSTQVPSPNHYEEILDNFLNQ